MGAYNNDKMGTLRLVWQWQVWSTALSGNAMYLYDLDSGGWFGRSTPPSNRTMGEGIWRCVAAARDALLAGLRSAVDVGAGKSATAGKARKRRGGDGVGGEAAAATPAATAGHAPPRGKASGVGRLAEDVEPPLPPPQPLQRQVSHQVFLFLDEASALHWPMGGPLGAQDPLTFNLSASQQQVTF